MDQTMLANMLVKDLKKLAKERGLRGYSRLKKAELLSLLRPIPAPRNRSQPIPAPRNRSQPIPAPKNIMNIRNPSINVPVLQPEIAVVRQNEAPSVSKRTIETFSGWLNWLGSISPSRNWLGESGKKS